jgi:hypothetical protein
MRATDIRGKAHRTFVVVFLLAFVAPAPAASQYLGGGTRTAAEVQIADLEGLRTKFIGLARAMPEETLTWKPMEGVRSVRDVLALIAAECTQFPTMWSFEKPAWVANGPFNEELSRLALLSKDELVDEIDRSFDHILGIVKRLSPADRARQVNFFGLNVDLVTAVNLMAMDMHEHLGQLIAYARSNRVVPPWSQGGGGV